MIVWFVIIVEKSQWVQLHVLATTVCENVLSMIENGKKFKLSNLNSNSNN